MTQTDVLFFDVLGTVVDWRDSITAAARSFLHRHGAAQVDAAAFAADWVGRCDAAVEDVRAGRRGFVPLDQLNIENLQACLAAAGLDPAALPPDDVASLNLAWHRLAPWPDAVEGISRLKQRFIVVPLSDGNTRLLVDMARHAGLPWDAILGADVFGAYKPMPEVYLRACDLLGVRPDRAMLVAAHGYDLAAARDCGLRTAYVARTQETTTAGWDHAALDLIDLAAKLTAG